MKAESGDKVKLVTKQETVEGILLPSFQEGVILIKLDNGYNVGFPEKEITKITVIEKAKEKAVSKSKETTKKNLPTISILHTGGTIASKVDYKTGGVFAGFTNEDFLGLFPEMSTIANIRSCHVANLMSEDMRFTHYQLLAKAIEEEIKKGTSGIIIGHGTDTIAITAAALSFMIEHPPIPIILVGSQRSSDRGSSDAAMNLFCAARFIIHSGYQGVGICMHEQSSDNACLIMPPTKTRKMHTSRRDAFKVVNGKPMAKIDYKTGTIDWINKPEVSTGKMLIHSKFEEKVAVIKTHVNMSSIFFDALNTHKFKGLVLEATGIGQAPTNIEENMPNYKALQTFIKNGGVVVLTSQCLFGAVHPDIYSNCRRLRDIGVIFGKDMLAETAHVKLAWLLGNYSVNDARKLITVNLRGEISERQEYMPEFLE